MILYSEDSDETVELHAMPEGEEQEFLDGSPAIGRLIVERDGETVLDWAMSEHDLIELATKAMKLVRKEYRAAQEDFDFFRL